MFAPNKGQELFAEGLAYETGDGRDADLAKAAELYSQAANLDFVPAMNRLAEMYMSASGVERDHQKGRELFQRSSDLGDAEGTFNLGMMLQAFTQDKAAATMFRSATLPVPTAPSDSAA